jgi:hypothetical protein
MYNHTKKKNGKKTFTAVEFDCAAEKIHKNTN